jgi:hemolysin activation/secretion protein
MMRPLHACLLLSACLLPIPAFAQEEADDGQRGIATAPTVLEEMEARDAAVPDLDRTPVLPGADEPGSDARLAVAPAVYVQQIRLDGNTLLDSGEVADLVSPYEGRSVSIEELYELRQRLSMAYFDRGYVNSGVVLPDQKVEAGVVRFESVTGRLGEVELSGNKALNDAFWRQRLAAVSADALQINDVQSTLRVIEQHPLVRRIEAQLMPGVEPGDSTLKLRVHENRRWRAVFGADNHRSPSLGGEQISVGVSNLSLSGRGDPLDVQVSGADGLGNYGLAYAFPFKAGKWTLRAYASEGDAEIVEAPFDAIDIESKTRTVGTELSYVRLRTPENSVAPFMGIEVQHSESTLLDQPFSFSPGEIDGEADSTALVLGVDWARRTLDQVLALRLSYRAGLSLFGARVNTTPIDGVQSMDKHFQALRLQVQHVRRLDWLDSEVHVRGAFQLARNPLLPVEKMPVGGAYSVRGYRENLLVRDNAVVGSLEWRVPLFAAARSGSGFDAKALTVALFSDFGQSWDQGSRLPSGRKERIYSVGLGLLWRPLPGLSADVYYGHALNDLPFVGDDIQDDGWHLRLGYQVF